MTPQNNELDEIITRLRNIGTEAYNEAYKIHGSNDYERVGLQMELEDKIAEEAKAKLEALIRARQVEARVDELVSFLAELDKQDPYIPLDGTPRQYVHNKANTRIAELKGKESK